MIENRFENDRNPLNLELKGWFGVPGRPPGVKMLQDAILDASWAPFGDLLGLVLAPRGAMWEPPWIIL